MKEDATAHGFRSAFRDRVSEETNHPGEIAEAALAHRVRDKTEAAYRRGNLLEKRRKLMDEWGAYCRNRCLAAAHSGRTAPHLPFSGGSEDRRLGTACGSTDTPRATTDN